MSTWMYQTKRLISYILLYALLFGALEPGAVRQVSAAARNVPYRTAPKYLQESQSTTQAGIVINGKEIRIEMYGSDFYVIDKELGNDFAVITTGAGVVATGGGVVTTGAGLVASGTAVNLAPGLTNNFAISGQGGPALFSFQTSRMEGNCQQFRIITEAAQGFDAWLLNQSLQPVCSVSGLGGSNILRKTLSNYTSYYLLVSGAAGTSGKLLYSDIIDDYGNDFSTAGDLYFNRDYAVETEIAGDVDVLTFCASPAVSAYRMKIQSVVGSGGTFEVYNQNKQKLSQYSGTLDTGAKDFIFAPEIGKRYYFRFTSGQTGRKILLQITQATTSYKITYHLRGGKNDKGNPSSYISTTAKFSLKKATRSKYLFYGWYTDSSYRNRIYSIQGSLRRNLNLYAKWEKVTPKVTSITSVKSKKKKQATVKWKKTAGIKGYKLIYGTTRSLKKKTKTKLTKKTSLKISGLKPGKTYYFKVCCYSKDSKGNKVYGKYSKVKKVKIKDKKKAAAKTAATKKKTTAAKKKTTAKATKKTTTKTTAAKKKTTAKDTKKTPKQTSA